MVQAIFEQCLASGTSYVTISLDLYPLNLNF